MIAAFALALLAAMPEVDPESGCAETSSVTWHKLSSVEICRLSRFVDDAQRGWALCRRAHAECAIDLQAKEHARIEAESRAEYAEKDAEECDAALVAVGSATTAPAKDGVALRVGIGPDTWVGVAIGAVAGALAALLAVNLF